MPNPPPVQVTLEANDAALIDALNKAQAQIANLGNRLNETTTSAGGAEHGFGRLERNLSSLVISATGADPHIGHLAATLGSMAIDGPIMIGAMAALGAIAELWELIGAKAFEASKKQEDAIQKVLEAAHIRELGGPVRAQMGGLIVERGQMRSDLASAQAQRARETDVDAAYQLDITIADLTKKIAERTTAIEELGAQLRDGTDKIKTSGHGAAAGLGSLTDQLDRLRGRLSIMPSERQMLGALNADLAPGDNRNMKGDGLINLQTVQKNARGKDILGGAAGSAIGTLDDLGLRRKNELYEMKHAGDGFDRASQVVVASFGAMAQAAIRGSGSMVSAITGALQAVVANIKTSSGGLFGSTFGGALVGVGIGLVGALFSRHSAPAPVHVANADEIASKMAAANAKQPIHVHQTIVTPEGQTVAETEYVLLNRESRDAVPRYTSKG